MNAKLEETYLQILNDIAEDIHPGWAKKAQLIECIKYVRGEQTLKIMARQKRLHDKEMAALTALNNFLAPDFYVYLPADKTFAEAWALAYAFVDAHALKLFKCTVLHLRSGNYAVEIYLKKG